MSDMDSTETLQAGQKLARGVCRLMVSLNFAPLTEFVPERGLRVDVIAIGPKGEVWIIECKSGLADFQSDHKWQGYLPWCDRFYWAVDGSFPVEVLPAETGLIVGDAYGAETLRHGPHVALASSRRATLIRKIARTAALRHAAQVDPGVAQFPG